MFTRAALSVATLAIALVGAQPMTNANAEPLRLRDRVLSDVLSETATPPSVAPGGVVGVEPGILLPDPVSCKGAKELVKNAGYKKIEKIECNGTVYTFKAKKNGQKYVVTVNRYSKQVAAI